MHCQVRVGLPAPLIFALILYYVEALERSMRLLSVAEAFDHILKTSLASHCLMKIGDSHF